jgi:hypothetical protein
MSADPAEITMELAAKKVKAGNRRVGESLRLAAAGSLIQSLAASSTIIVCQWRVGASRQMRDDKTGD